MVILADTSRESINRTYLNERYSHVKTAPDEVTQSYIDLICEIIVQAVEDWRYLKSKDTGATLYLTQMIYRAELVDFFNSKLFEEYLQFALPELEPADVRIALSIPKLNGREKQSNGYWNRKYDS